MLAANQINRNECFAWSILEALPDHICVLDARGVILLVNEAWRRFARQNPPVPARCFEGENYLALCDRVAGPEAPQAQAFAAALRALLGGEQQEVIYEYACHSQKEQRWFLAKACAVEGVGGSRAVIAHEEITRSKQAQQELRAMSEMLLHVEEVERGRIARELHDSMGQKLAALGLLVGRINEAWSVETHQSTSDLLTEAHHLTEECTQELQTISHLLHPPLLEELGLDAALDTYIAGFIRRSGIQVKLNLPPALGRLPPETELVIFRVVQESLSNVHRHSGSRVAEVHLCRAGERLVLEVLDQGGGIPSKRLGAIWTQPGVHGLGVAGMQQRLRHLGGELKLETTAQGTTVRALIPLSQTRG
jgi:two-component system, NarL family, sensor kinase